MTRRRRSVWAFILATSCFCPIFTLSASETVTYTYDALGRLIKVSRSGTVNNGVNAAYSYDKADNRANVAVGYTWTAVSWRGGDFNGDGRSDILWREDDGTLTDWLATSSGGFAANWANFATDVSLDWVVAGAGDFNGDGRDDILWRNGNGTISDWLGTANGAFTINDSNAATFVPHEWRVAGIGDFNGDGRSDILWREDDGTLTDWLATSSGGFAANWANFATDVSLDWVVAGAGDFNGDGRDDILWRHTDGTLSDWLGAANGGFVDNSANGATGVPVEWHVVGTGDFNGDGRDDILWRHNGGALADWLGTTNGGYVDNASNAYYQVDTSWQVVGTGDYNGDGRDDILWRSNSGTLSNWLGTPSGAFTNNDANALSEVPTIWHVEPR